jgi:hypothetical protein
MRWLRRLLPDRGSRRVPLAEPMEPRLLYSADLTAGLMLATTTATAAPEVRTLSTTGEYAGATAATDGTAAAASAYTSASLAFEANAGQAGDGVEFSAYGSGYGIALDGGQAALTLVTADGQHTVTLQLQDAAAAPQGEGEGLLATRSNVIVGSDPSQWATGLSNYASVLYRGVYDGVDLRYYGNQRQLEYDFVVAPGADAAQIALRFDGIVAASIADDGDLVLQVAGTSGEVRFCAPVSYQRADDGSMQAVASRYELRADGSIGFLLGAYDASRELVIDPVLSYASYFGTAGTEDAPAVAVDATGNVYITGRTNSNAAPLGSSVGAGGGAGDIFVAKFSPDLSTLLFTTRIGGAADEQGNAIAVDASGNIIVTGWTSSNDFPTLAANDATRSGTQDAVLLKLNASGSLVFGTYIGGTGNTDEGRAVAVDGAGNIYVTGQTTSSGLLDPVLALVLGSSDNAFVEKYSASGSLLYHKELGGGSMDLGTGIALGAGGDVFVVGNTQSSNMNVTGGEQSALRGAVDGFLAHLDASGNTLYQSYVGGTDADTATAVTTDGTGKAYVVGVTRARSSVVFTTTAGAYQTSALISNGDTGFLRIYDTTKTGSASLQYSTYIGGSNSDLPSGVALYGGDVVVVGRASSTTDFPVTADAVQATNTGTALYLVQIHPGGAGAADLRYGTFYAGGFVNTGNAVLQGNRVYAAGQISSSNWATTGAYDTARQGNDAFVAVFTLANTAPVLNGVVQPPAIAEDDVGNAGVLVTSLVAGQITDADVGAVQGIAVVASDTTHGSWEYTLDGSTWQALSAPSASSALLLPADAQTRVRFVPATDYNGTVTSGLTLRAWDRTTGIAGGRANITATGGTTAFSTASFGVNITVTPVNDAPVANADSFTTAEDTPLVISLVDLLANDTDVEGSTLTVVSVANGTGGTVVLNGNGTIKFTPNANFNGTATFSYVISDGAANSLPGTVTITVTPVNDAPVANDDSGTTNEDTPITFTAAQLLGNDTDVEGSALTIVSVSGTGAVLNADGSVTFTPAANFNGTTSFSYRISDGTTLSQSGKVTVVVNPVNDPPVAIADSLNAVSNTPITYTAAQLLGNDTDVDGDVLTIGSVASGSGGTVVLNANGTVTFTPTAGFAGNASFSYTAKDASLSSAPATVTVRVNDVPVAAADTVSATEDTPVTYSAGSLLGNDTDVVGNPLAITGVASGTGGTAVLNADGSVTFTPFANFNGPGSFSYTVSDGSLVSSPATVTVNVAPVNDAPTNSGAITLPAMPEDGGPVTITQAQLLGNAADVDGDALSVVSLVASSGSLVANGNGSWSFTPGANANGPVQFTYVISDGTASTAGAASLQVNPVNDAPVATAVVLPGMPEDSGSLTITAAQLLANASDVDGDSLSVVNLVASTGTLVANGGGTWTFTPGSNYNGTVGFTYGITDGTAVTAATATLSVAPVNDAPTTSNVTLPAMQEDGTITITAAQLLANAADVDGDTLSIANVTASSGTLTANANGTWTFQPLANANGPLTFAYDITDGLVTIAGTASLQVDPVNDAPVSAPVTLSDMLEDSGSITITAAQLLANASDVDGDTLSVVNLVASTGTLVANAGGTWTFTPGANYNGTVGFTYGIGDGTATTPATATLAVTPVNDAPTTSTVTLPSMQEDGTITIASAQLLANAADVDGDALAVANLSASSGTLVANGNGTWTFTPPANANGPVSFTYTVTDGTATTAGTASLQVDAVNDAPVSTPVALPGMAEDGGSITITAAQLLANASDIDGDSLSVVNLVASTGTLVANGSGTWTFTPGADYNGTVGFTYGISDGTVTTPAAAALVVTAVNDVPTTSVVTLPAMQEDGTITITSAQLLANAADVEGDTLSVANLAASSGTLVANGNGTWTFTPAADANGPVAFAYGVTDGTATTAGSGTLQVSPVNDAPVTSPVSLPAMAEDGGPVTITQGQLLANATDVDGDALSVLNLVSGSGTVVDNGNGTWSYTPAANASGSVTFTYGISDGLATSAGAASLQVNPVNDAPVSTPVALPGMPEDSGSVTITAAQLLANASDIDGDRLSVVNLVASTGSLAANGGGTWTFTPGANYNGTVGFSYGISDGTVTTSAAATLVVAPVNDAPTASSVTLPAMQEDGATITITSAQLLANAGDVDGDPLSVANLSASSGVLLANGNGTWSFTPGANANGPVTFTYDVSDGTATTTSAASLQVVPVNDTPTSSAVVLPATAEDGGAVTITAAQLLANAADVEGDALSVGNLSASSGTLVANGNGTWTFTPARDFNGVVVFSYTVTDGTTGASGTASLQVTPVDDAPQVTSDGAQGSAIVSIPENTLMVTTVTASDVDTPVPALVFGIVGGADAALFTIDSATGALAFARTPDFEAPTDANRDNVYEVVVQVSDGTSATRQALAVHVTDAQEPVVTVPAPAPAAAPGVAPAVPAPAPITSSVAAPAPATAAPVAGTAASDTRGNRTAESLQEALGPTMATPIASFNSSEASFASAPARIALAADPTHVFRTVVFDRGGVELISTQGDDQLVLARFGIDSRPDGTRLDDFQRTLRSAAFASQLDRLRESVRDDLDLDRSINISVVSVSLGLSLVYVLWLIRGGVLIGSYLSALPAWRMLDPLPVLSRVDEEEDDEEPLEGGRRDGRDTLRGFG